MTLIIENAKFTNNKTQTIVIKDGIIADLTDEDHEWEGEVIVLADDMYVSPGWIDLHTHAFPKFKPYCAFPDDIGYLTGVTTVVDAGSSGADDFAEFYDKAKRCKTNVLSFLNVSKIGLKVRDELADLANISFPEIESLVKKYPETIVGLKVRMSQSVIGESGIKPLEMAKEMATKLHLPLMVHVGNSPPKLAEILSYLGEGDVVTHCFNEKPNNHIFSGENLEAVIEAISRGVYLDVGHGTSSFSFDIARRAKQENIAFHSISTDIYKANQQNGPVFNMATTLTKFLALGYTLDKVIHSVTKKPAKTLRNEELGEIKVGAEANLTFFKVSQKEVLLTDSLGNNLISPRQIVPCAVFIGGNYYDIRKNKTQTSS